MDWDEIRRNEASFKKFQERLSEISSSSSSIPIVKDELIELPTYNPLPLSNSMVTDTLGNSRRLCGTEGSSRMPPIITNHHVDAFPLPPFNAGGGPS